MKSHLNDIFYLSANTHVRIKIHREFHHCIVYIANEEGHIRMDIITHNIPKGEYRTSYLSIGLNFKS